MKVIYSNDIGREAGVCYRRLDQFFGVIAGASEVVVKGDAPHIVDAYRKAGIQVDGGTEAAAKPSDGLTVEQLREALTTKGVEIPADAKKADLQKLLDEA
jgi:hypothetical protein